MNTVTESSFILTDEHIKNVCKPGAGSDTCRFLTMGKTFTCSKFSSLMTLLHDKFRNNEMIARGNNCNALLAEIIKAKDELISKKITYVERMPTYESEGTLVDICIDGQFLSIDITTKDGTFPFQVNIDLLQIGNYEDRLTFEVCGLSAYAGSVTIFK